MECAGYVDILSKCVGSRTSVNVVRAVFSGLGQLLDAQEVAKNRGKTLKDMWS
jgi:small subunit ribosomal protein S5